MLQTFHYGQRVVIKGPDSWEFGTVTETPSPGLPPEASRFYTILIDGHDTGWPYDAAARDQAYSVEPLPPFVLAHRAGNLGALTPEEKR